jgi:hypothetical protein
MSAALLVALGGCLSEDLYPPRGVINEAESPLEEATREKIDKILTQRLATSAHAYYELFESNDSNQLRELLGRVPPGVELQIAWELLRRTVAKRETATLRPVDPVSLKQFASLLERRLGEPLPAWWKETLLSASSHSRGVIGFAVPELQGPGFRVKNAAELLRDGDRVMLTIDGQTASLPQEVTDDFTKHCNASINAAFSHDLAYVAVYNDGICAGYSLFCIDQKTGHPRWRESVWATPRPLIVQGSIPPTWHHMVNISVVDGSVFVFGTSRECVYIEAFDAVNGAALFRFSTKI